MILAFGAWQIVVLMVIPIGIIVGLILLFTSRAKHKAKAETLESISNKNSTSNKNSLDQLERLNKLRESGALSKAEYEIEKHKILS